MSEQLALTGEFMLYTSEDGQTRVTLVPTLCVGMPTRLAESHRQFNSKGRSAFPRGSVGTRMEGAA